jgi:hypothetical protein
MATEDVAFTSEYDELFRKIQNLNWLPWVGINFPGRSPDRRLLIIGESHYAWVAQVEQLEQHRKSYFGRHNYTREVIAEDAIRGEWHSRTLDTIPKLLFKTSRIDLKRFWAHTAYYNFIQTNLPHYNRGASPERPTPEDFVLGWPTFAEVVRVLRPSHCLFIGVLSTYHFNDCMRRQKVQFEEIRRTAKIGRTWGRAAKLKIEDSMIELCFVQHLGKYFNWRLWHDYLQTHHPEMMNWLNDEAYPL